MLHQIVQRAASAAEQGANAGTLTAVSDRAYARADGRRTGDRQYHIPGRMTSAGLGVVSCSGHSAASRIVSAPRIVCAAAAGCRCVRGAILVTVTVSRLVAFLEARGIGIVSAIRRRVLLLIGR